MRMDIPFAIIANILILPDSLSIGSPAGHGCARITLACAPLFFFEPLSRDILRPGELSIQDIPTGLWTRCNDWTEGSQGNTVFQHDLIGPVDQLRHLVDYVAGFSMTRTASTQISHRVLPEPDALAAPMTALSFEDEVQSTRLEDRYMSSAITDLPTPSEHTSEAAFKFDETISFPTHAGVLQYPYDDSPFVCGSTTASSTGFMVVDDYSSHPSYHLAMGVMPGSADSSSPAASSSFEYLTKEEDKDFFKFIGGDAGSPDIQ